MMLGMLFLLATPLSTAQVSGCCSNPGAGIFACNFQTLVVRDTQCCPKPEANNPSFYKSAQFPSYPINSQDCAANFFAENAGCDSVPACKTGCCCAPSGPSTTSKLYCTDAGSEFFDKPCSQVSCTTPECNDGLDNDGNGCADAQDTGCVSLTDTNEENGICLGQGQGCSDPAYTPKLNALSITPVKGQKQLFLSWADECGQNALSYDIFRCRGNGCTTFTRIGSTSTTTFTDSSDALLFDTTYTYMAKAFYSVQSVTPTVQKTASLGNIECLGQATADKFCVQPSTYLAQKDYFIINFPLNFSSANFINQVRDKFSSRLNKAFSCDQSNILQPGGVSCTSDETCIMKGSVPACVPKDNCQQDSFNPFQLFGSQQLCENGKYCFYDASSSPANACYFCKPEMSCYDYKSEGACTRDNCGITSCKWNSLSTELGTGVCISTQQNNCPWCDKPGTDGMESSRAHNKVYEACTKEKTDKLTTPSSQCIFTGATAKTCDNVICTDIAAANCPSTPVQLAGGNVLAKRGGQCGADMCALLANKCRKDADADGIADCPTTSCETDIFPPETTIVPVLSNGSLNQLRIDIRDKTSANGALALRTTNDYGTLLCTGTCPANHPFGTSTLSQSLLYSNRKLFDKSTLQIIMNLSAGDNIISYYSQDPSKNVGLIKTVTFSAPSSSTGPIVGNLSVPNSAEVLDTIYAGSIPSATVKFLESASITFAQLKNPTTGDLFTPTFSSLLQQTTEFTFSATPPDGTYVLEVNAKNSEGVFMSPSFSKQIIIDGKPPVLQNSTPANNSVLRASSVPFSLNFTRETTILSIVLDDKELANNFTTINNKVYTATLNISDGNKLMRITARSFAGVVTIIPLRFIMNAQPLDITLVSPLYGVSPASPFEVRIHTDNDATCRHSTGSASDFSFMDPFSSTGGTDHVISSYSRTSGTPVTLFITCNDPLQGRKTASFPLSLDSTPPKIVTSFAFPDPVQDLDNITQLTIQTDEDAICKYSKTTADISRMTPFDSYAAANFSKISRQPVSEQTEGTFTYNVACQNKALLESAVQTLTFSVNHTLPTFITSLTPPVLGNGNLQLSVKTSKNVQCRFSQTDPTAVTGSLFGPPALTHTKTLSLEDGAYTMYVACRDQFLPEYSSAVLINFTVDTRAPNMLFVDDSSTFDSFPQQSCFTDRLRVKWLAEDKGSGVKEYYYSLLQGSTAIVGFTRSVASNEFLFIKNLSLLDNTKYYFTVKSRDFVDLESQTMLSDGVTVDTSLCKEAPKCGDGKINTAGEQCDGSAFGSVRSCGQYTNFVGGSLKCTPQCRIDTTDCTVASACGNGVLDAGEECDGKILGKISTCVSFNGTFSSGTLGCTSSCQLNTTSCVPKASCGNNQIDPGETCDGSSFGPLDGSCASYSPLRFTSGSLKCTNCQIDASSCEDVSPGLCGDGALNKGESCDGAALGALTSCTSYPSFSGGTLACTSGCALSTSQCTRQSSCGNSRIDPGESCDGTNLGPITSPTCSDYSSLFRAGPLSCGSSCTFNTKECKITQEDLCGNGKLDTGELCDKEAIGNVSDISCGAYSPYFLNGTLNCKLCRLSTENCLANDSLILTCRDRGDCPVGTNCTDSADCDSGFCAEGVCAAATCTDGVVNQNEPGIDCGGPCSPCPEGERCYANSDCATSLCSFGFCKAAQTCQDGALSPGESGVDCGGACETPCGQGEGCNSDADCSSGLSCRQGACSSCTEGDSDCNGVQDADEQTGGDDAFLQWAIEHGLDTSNPGLGDEDLDGDGLSNKEEFSYRTDPLNVDTDGDGFTDAEEIAAGTDPIDPDDYPRSSILSTILLALLVLGILGGVGYLAYNRYFQGSSRFTFPSLSGKPSGKAKGSLPMRPQAPSPLQQVQRPQPAIRPQPALPPMQARTPPPSPMQEKINERIREKRERQKEVREKVFSAFGGRAESGQKGAEKGTPQKPEQMKEGQPFQKGKPSPQKWRTVKVRPPQHTKKPSDDDPIKRLKALRRRRK